MNHRLSIIQPIMPRSPLALVAVRLPSIAGGARKNLGYTPLSLIFRRAREAKSRSMPPITYVSRGGEKVVIAPRINLTIQWAERLGDLLDLGQPSVQRSQSEGSRPLSLRHPITGRKRLALTTTIDQQERKESGRVLSLPPVVSKSDLIPTSPLVQQDPGARHAASSVSTFAAKNYLTLFNTIDRQIKRATQAVISTPAVVSRRDLKLAARRNSAPGPVESTFFNTRAGDDVQFAGHRKKRGAAVPSFPQRRREPALIPASALDCPGRPLPVSVAFKSKFLGRIQAPEVQSKVHRPVRITDDRFLTKTGRWAAMRSAVRFGERANGALDPMTSDAGSRAHARPGIDHGNTSWRSDSLHYEHLSKQQSVAPRQPGGDHERPISPAEVQFRTEKSPPPPPSETVPSAPVPAPAQPPRIDIDRLSRDVWRQLEKRIRIERERHGRL